MSTRHVAVLFIGDDADRNRPAGLLLLGDDLRNDGGKSGHVAETEADPDAGEGVDVEPAEHPAIRDGTHLVV